jgi:hypothetical protein
MCGGEWSASSTLMPPVWNLPPASYPFSFAFGPTLAASAWRRLPQAFVFAHQAFDLHAGIKMRSTSHWRLRASAD